MKVLSLFAGIGGIDLGCESVGWKTVAYSEFDPKLKRQYAAEVMAARFPDVPNAGDVTRLVFAKNRAGLQGVLRREDDDSLTTIWKEAPGTRIDIIVGGFP